MSIDDARDIHVPQGEALCQMCGCRIIEPHRCPPGTYIPRSADNTDWQSVVPWREPPSTRLDPATLRALIDEARTCPSVRGWKLSTSDWAWVRFWLQSKLDALPTTQPEPVHERVWRDGPEMWGPMVLVSENGKPAPHVPPDLAEAPERAFRMVRVPITHMPDGEVRVDFQDSNPSPAITEARRKLSECRPAIFGGAEVDPLIMEIERLTDRSDLMQRQRDKYFAQCGELEKRAEKAEAELARIHREADPA